MFWLDNTALEDPIRNKDKKRRRLTNDENYIPPDNIVMDMEDRWVMTKRGYRFYHGYMVKKDGVWKTYSRYNWTPCSCQDDIGWCLGHKTNDKGEVYG